MTNSFELDFKTFFSSFIIFQILVVSNLSYFGTLFENPKLNYINQIFIIVSVAINIGICIAHYFYKHISNFLKALENFELFALEEDENNEEVNKYDLNMTSKNEHEKIVETIEENIKSEDSENENIKTDEILNQSNEELNEYLSGEYNKAINGLMDLIQREISKKDD